MHKHAWCQRSPSRSDGDCGTLVQRAGNQNETIGMDKRETGPRRLSSAKPWECLDPDTTGPVAGGAHTVGDECNDHGGLRMIVKKGSLVSGFPYDARIPWASGIGKHVGKEAHSCGLSFHAMSHFASLLLSSCWAVGRFKYVVASAVKMASWTTSPVPESRFTFTARHM